MFVDGGPVKAGGEGGAALSWSFSSVVGAMLIQAMMGLHTAFMQCPHPF